MILQELKLQAGIGDNPDQEGLDLFAELIVAECVQEVEGQAILMDAGHNQWNRAVGHIMSHLKQHFGVEP